IGEAARVGGQVALAVACGRHLAELGSVRGPELVEQIIEAYAGGRQRSAAAPPRARAPTLPPPLPAPTSPPALPAPSADPLVEARTLLERLGSWLMARH